MPKYKITIEYDQMPDNPLDWDDNLIVACKHSRYDLGNYSFDDLMIEYDLDDEYLSFGEILTELNKHGVAYPLSMIDHSGISVYIGNPCCSWDSGYIGVVFVHNEDIDDCPKDRIDSIIECYNDYLNGYVYCGIVEVYTSEGMEFVYGSCNHYDMDELKQIMLDNVPIEYRDNVEWVGLK